MRVFVVGFNKCGTTSMHRLFEAAGLRSLHWRRGPEDEPCALAMRANQQAGLPIIAGFEDYQAFSNLDYFCEHQHVEMSRHFRLLMEQEPDARFILNVRDVDRWIRSRMDQFSERPARPPLDDCPGGTRCSSRLSFAEKYSRYFKISKNECQTHLRCVWHSHINAVRSEIPHDRLLVFDVERDDPLSICNFLDLPPAAAASWGRRNPSLPLFARRVSRYVPVSLKRRMPAGVKDRLKALVSHRVFGA